ncbi:MAG: AAA family ATPase, partial [Halobacteriota archaeon]|nr:AAA family ATPase [Halobacteriota archaeon]
DRKLEKITANRPENPEAHPTPFRSCGQEDAAFDKALDKVMVGKGQSYTKEDDEEYHEDAVEEPKEDDPIDPPLTIDEDTFDKNIDKNIENSSVNRLTKLGLKSNPFRSYGHEDAALDKVMVGREDEVEILETIIDFFKMGSKKNTVLIGEDGIGKTTIIQSLIRKLKFEKSIVLYHAYFPSFKQIVTSLAQNIGDSLENVDDVRELGNMFLSMCSESMHEVIQILDNLEDLLGCSDVDREEYVRMFKESNVLFICATTLEGWKKLLEKWPALSSVFTQIYVKPLDIDKSSQIVKKRLEMSRVGGKNGYSPFTKGAVETITTYAFFVPGKIVDFTSRMMIEAMIEKRDVIDEVFVRRVLLEKSAFYEYYKQLSDRQVNIIEEIIKNGGEANFNFLSDAIGISRVAIADHIQKLVDLGLVEYIDAQGREKLFRVTNNIKVLVG